MKSILFIRMYKMNAYFGTVITRSIRYNANVRELCVDTLQVNLAKKTHQIRPCVTENATVELRRS